MFYVAKLNINSEIANKITNNSQWTTKIIAELLTPLYAEKREIIWQYHSFVVILQHQLKIKT